MFYLPEFVNQVHILNPPQTTGIAQKTLSKPGDLVLEGGSLFCLENLRSTDNIKELPSKISYFTGTNDI